MHIQKCGFPAVRQINRSFGPTMRILFLTFFSAFFGFVATGCRDKHTTSSTPAASQKPTRNQAIAECANKGLAEFRTLSIAGKALADIPDVGEGVSLSYRIAIERDKAILIRVNKLIEIARIYITPEEIVTLDRLNSVAYVNDYSVARTYVGLDADFALLQDLITGSLNVIPDTMNQTAKVNGVASYVGQRAGIGFQYDVAEDDCRPRRLEAQNSARQQHTRILYPEFEEIGKTKFAKSVNIELLEPKKAAISLAHSSIIPDEAEFSINFSIPENYTVKRQKN